MTRPTCSRCKLPIEYGETYQHPYGDWDSWAHTECLPADAQQAVTIKRDGLASYIPETQRGKIVVGR